MLDVKVILNMAALVGALWGLYRIGDFIADKAYWLGHTRGEDEDRPAKYQFDALKERVVKLESKGGK